MSDASNALLEWGAWVRRDLPWRRTRDPWAILVSEVMLQQTQVARVVPKWHEFLDRWPTPADVAAATLPELLGVWSGLGYPRRLRSLQSAARVVVEHHDGTIPGDLDALLALPGVGPYTARAVLAFAFDADVGVVDTNIARVLARREGRRLTTGEAQRVADEFVEPGTAWSHNQSLMDLGALLCRPEPTCGECPLADGCAWALAGHPAPDPAVGSAGVSGPQSRFEGSDRQGRGRLLRAAAIEPVGADALAEAMGWPNEPDRARRVALTLVADGFLREVDGQFALNQG